MKTKEIDVWVRHDEIDSNGISCQTNRHDKWQLRAKLIIEIPEKKIEITESQFDEALIMVIAQLQKLIAWDMHLGDQNKKPMLDELEAALKLIGKD